MTRRCIVCGREFKPNRPKRVLCGDAVCKRARKAQTNRKLYVQHHKHDPKTMLPRRCEICNREYQPHKIDRRTCGGAACIVELKRRYSRERPRRADRTTTDRHGAAIPTALGTTKTTAVNSSDIMHTPPGRLVRLLDAILGGKTILVK